MATRAPRAGNSTNAVLEAALGYAQFGWHVFPCHPADSAPLTEHGFKDALVDPEQIAVWWRRWPRAMIGVATGASKLAILDVDIDKTKGLDGEVAFATLLNGHTLPPDLTVSRTPRGGRHIYFAARPDLVVPSTVGRLGLGLDTRGEGGYVIAPPSVNGAGLAYTWESWGAFHPAPDWLVAAKPERPHQDPKPDPEASDERRLAYGARALADECARIATASEGRRNDTLFKSACCVFELVKGNCISESRARAELEEAAAVAGLDVKEVRGTLDSAWARTEERGPTERPQANGAQGAGATGATGATGTTAPHKARLFDWQEYRKHYTNSGGASLIEGLIRIGTLISINGRPGASKSALVIEISRCLVAGELFLGRETTKSVVLYIASEDEADIVNRLEALKLDNVMIVVAEEGVPLTKPDKAVAVIKDAIHQGRAEFPDCEIFIPFDTLRSGLGDQSVLDDRYASPTLNKLRELAEEEGVVICVVNHTNRQDPKQTKGETLESVVALEFILLEASDDWFELHVGKNRSGPSRRQIGRLKCTSIQVGNVAAAVVDQIEAVEGGTEGEKERKLGSNQALIMKLMKYALADHHGSPHRPFADGPEVMAVKEATLREIFIQRKAGDDRHKKQKVFDQTLNALLGRLLMRGENANGEGVIWLAQKADEAEAIRT